MLTIDELVKRVSYLTESYIFGESVLNIEKLKKKKIKIAKEHMKAVLDTLSDIIDNLQIVVDETDYGLRAKMLSFLLEAYDSLTKAVKYYHYAKQGELEYELGIHSELNLKESEETQGEQED